ncbi:XrtA/PEP-CTERM system-associated ATPase [Piscinibacter sp.]|uniref:XrtA/PEP-CTERM system-associated ATPase n=1 Tax=Piscinibacter sp. TaxID=1903157 RepID=UPI0039E412A2
MYESHFGLSSPPFQLNPDPTFFFDSRGHKNALAYLQFGAHQGEGFIVVTGEIGAGKTTVVNALLNGLDRDKVVAAKVVSTQLEAGDLLRAIMTAFGIPPTAPSKAQLIATLEAFLTAVAASGRRALLVVDEAQNLNRTAVEELRMLSNFQLGSHGLLQSFLVGQPELRALLQSKSMEQLRQRVIASCHLGPLDVTETQGYIEHRLHIVGWHDDPSFDPLAFAEIHRWTEGVPRRINRLCSRLLLGAYLQDLHRIDVALVRETARELGVEVGDTPIEGAGAPLRVLASAPAARNEPLAGEAQGAAAARPVLCVVDTMPQYYVARSLAAAARLRAELPGFSTVWVDSGRSGALAFESERPRSADYVELAPEGTGGDAMERAFQRLLDRERPTAVIVCASSHTAFDCAMAAFRSGVPVLRVSSGRRRWWATHEQRVRLELFERLAALLYTDSLAASHALHRSGIPVDRVQCSGDMAAVVVRAATECVSAQDVDDLLARAGLDGAQGFVLATLAFTPGEYTPEQTARIVNRLEDIARRTPVLWLADERTRLELSTSGHESRLRDSPVHLLAAPDFGASVALLMRSAALVADTRAVLVESALARGLPCMLLDQRGAASARPLDAGTWPSVEFSNDVDAVFDAALAQSQAMSEADAEAQASAATGIVDHLAGWLPAVGGRAKAPAITLEPSRGKKA